MTDPNFILLYVTNPERSAEFYQRLLGKPPVEASPTFALFALDSGVMLGLWAQHTVAPAAQLSGGGAELAFSVPDRDTVNTLHTTWQAQGLSILQPPTDMEFGYTFLALDPDQHRLRVFQAGM